MPLRVEGARAGLALAAFAGVLIAFVTALNFVFIPLHAPDDTDHFERAYLLSRGEIWPQARPGSHSGGMVDEALRRYAQQERPAIVEWPRQGELRESIGPPAEVRDAKWSGQEAFNPFEAAAITYLPLIYLPQTVAIWVGRSLDLSIESTIRLARELNGLAAIGLGCAVLALWPIPSAVVMLLAFLPKTMLHLASNSPDPIYYAAVIGVIGMLWHAWRGERGGVWRYVVLALGFLVICPVRPPVAALAVPVFLLAWRERAWAGAATVALSLALSATWTLTILATTVTDACADEQIPVATKILAFLRASVWIIPDTFKERGWYFLISGIGELGWGNGPAGYTDALPAWVYPLALAMLAFAVVVDAATPVVIARPLRFAFGLAALGMVFIVFLALYVTCSSYLQPIVRGIQGRYFVPVLLCLVPVFAGLTAPRPALRRWYGACLYVSGLAWFALLTSEGLRIYWMR